MVKKKKIKTSKKSFVKRKVVSKPILKRTNVVVRVSSQETPSILGDPNRFFKDKYEEDKRQFYFK